MAAFEIGNRLSFTYLKGAEKNGNGSRTQVDYASRAENYNGTVVEVRDIDVQPLADSTYNYGAIKGERSKNLVTVELAGGDTKAFYDGRMVNRTVTTDQS